MDNVDNIKQYIRRVIDVLEHLDCGMINKAIHLIKDTKDKGGRVYICGNGGSAATASHMANDFNKVSCTLDVKYDFICLSDNIPTIMAIANDDCYENVFLKQIENKLKVNDILIAISGSGNSENIIRAVKYAKDNGNKVIAFTGFDGGKLRLLSDISLNANVNSMQISEDIHVIFNHIMMSTLYNNK